MMAAREELLAKEESSWKAFWSDVSKVPADRVEEPGIVEGWSTKDMVWHCGYWARFCAEALESLTGPDFTDPFEGHDDAYWDEYNGRVAKESAAMSWDEVAAALPGIRERVRAALTAAPEGDKPDAWFGEETFEHYDEHAEHVRAFLVSG